MDVGQIKGFGLLGYESVSPGRPPGFLVFPVMALIGDHIYNIFQRALGANLLP